MSKLRTHILKSIEVAEASIEQLQISSAQATRLREFKRARKEMDEAERTTRCLAKLQECLQELGEPKAEKNFHPGPFYDEHILEALRLLGGKATLVDVQNRMHLMLRDQMTSEDLDSAPGSNRPRYRALSAARISVLMTRGQVQKQGEKLVLLKKIVK